MYDIAAQKADDALEGDTDPIMTAVMEGDSNFANASPLNFVRPDLPPVLLIHGDADETVDIGVTRTFPYFVPLIRPTAHTPAATKRFASTNSAPP